MAEKLPSCQNLYFSAPFSKIEGKTTSEAFQVGNKKWGNSAMHVEASEVLGLGQEARCRDAGQAASFGQGQIIFTVIMQQM